MTLTLSFAACLLWGIADFIGGFKSRRLSAVAVIFISSIFSVITLSAILIVRPEHLPSSSSVFWAVVAGVFGIFSMYFLYKGLSLGMMSVVAPIAATGVVIPVFAGVVKGESLSPVQIAGMAASVVGVIFVSMGKKLINDRKGLRLALKYAVLAAVFSGLYLISVAKTGHETPFWSILVLRMTYLLLLLPVVLFKRTVEKFDMSHLFLLAGMGLVDTFAGLAFVAAAGIGLLSVVSVVSSLYPAVTVLLSVGILKERLTPHQLTGVALAFGGIVMLSV